MRRTTVATALAATALVLAAGCSSGTPQPRGQGSASGAGAASPAATPSVQLPPAKGSVKVARTVVQDLRSPWGIAALPEGGLLVGSRDDGSVLHVDTTTGAKSAVGSVPGVDHQGEGGLLGLALSPTYGADHLVYAYFTTESDNRIARMNYDPKRPAGQQLGAPDTILRGIPKGTVHNGGQIAFGPDRMLYAGTGETGDRGLAQDKTSLGGKILRMTPDGQPAYGNPDADSVVYSPGHRNVQGLAWDSENRLWASEFGQDTWDELNYIEPGKNYGWPVVEGRGGKPGYVDPVAQWKTSEASPSGIAYTGGSVWLAALKGERLWRVPLNGTTALAAPEAFLTGRYGRLRTVLAAGPGKLWALTNNTDSRGTPKPGDDRILELDVT
ncbi:sorbosone dehydrogenase family protein [Streptomyces sp. NBC_00083]|uniref:PQQ-dependent sugar dehydrogenase n=1 Tax=Streptomyces sp. NBC_00083 TaxID=2975647 RepID=UPI002259B438|nr:PQQ-dependent sugar dehydrogenase [Streptomyces sp. NBC_00083]MCX5385848.1 PQQ-dependent sugar dehydrogenase [Streptomyces sp. NBC_00083]